jgi:hypothetical protein
MAEILNMADFLHKNLWFFGSGPAWWNDLNFWYVICLMLFYIKKFVASRENSKGRIFFKSSNFCAEQINQCCHAWNFKMAPKFKMDAKMFLSVKTCTLMLLQIFCEDYLSKANGIDFCYIWQWTIDQFLQQHNLWIFYTFNTQYSHKLSLLSLNANKKEMKKIMQKLANPDKKKYFTTLN